MTDATTVEQQAKDLMSDSSDAWNILNGFHASVSALLVSTYPVVRAMFAHKKEILEFVAHTQRPRIEEVMDDVQQKVTDFSSRVRQIHDKHKGRYGHPNDDDNAFAIAEEYTSVADDFADFQKDSLHVMTVTINDWLASVKETENV